MSHQLLRSGFWRTGAQGLRGGSAGRTGCALQLRSLRSGLDHGKLEYTTSGMLKVTDRPIQLPGELLDQVEPERMRLVRVESLGKAVPVIADRDAGTLHVMFDADIHRGSCTTAPPVLEGIRHE